MSIEDKIRELFKNFNESVSQVCSDRSKTFYQREDHVESKRDELRREYCNLFESRDDAQKFNFVDILKSCHNEFTQRHFDFMTMLSTKFKGSTPEEKDILLLTAPRIEISNFLNYDNYFILLSECQVTNCKFDDLMTIRSIFTGRSDKLLENLFDDYRLSLKKKFPHLSSEIDSFKNDYLNDTSLNSLLQADKEGGHKSLTNLFNHENFIKTIKANSLRDSKWELREDPFYNKIQTLTQTYPELKLIVNEFENITLSSAMNYEKNEYPSQRVPLLLSDLEKKQILDEKDLLTLIEKAYIEILKESFNEEEIFSILLRMIKIIAKADKNVLYPDTFSIIDVIGNIIVNRAILDCYEMTWILHNRISNKKINLERVTDFNCKSKMKLNRKTFSYILGIVNHLKLIETTFDDFVKNL